MITQLNCCSRILSALVVVCAMAAIFPQPAAAQTASDLKCNKCVGTKDIAKKAINKSRIKKGAVNESRLSTDLKDHVNERESFYITLDGNGSTVTIATHGPLRFFARCIVGFFDPTRFDPDTGMNSGLTVDRIEVVATSSQEPWYEEDESDESGGSVTPPSNALLAGQQFVVFTADVTTGNAHFDNDIDENAMIGPGGFYMAIDGETLGLGLNVYGHDCTVIGNVLKITAP